MQRRAFGARGERRADLRGGQPEEGHGRRLLTPALWVAHMEGRVELSKETAHNREPWLRDFPETARLYAAMSRNTRNTIGHALVRHDIARGVLVHDDGREQNYLLFLIDTLAAVRLSHYLLDVIQLLDYMRPAPVTEAAP